MSFHHTTVDRREPDRGGFGDQIANRQHQPVVADHHAVTHAFGSQHLGRESIFRDLRANSTTERSADFRSKPTLSGRGCSSSGKAQ